MRWNQVIHSPVRGRVYAYMEHGTFCSTQAILANTLYHATMTHTINNGKWTKVGHARIRYRNYCCS